MKSKGQLQIVTGRIARLIVASDDDNAETRVGIDKSSPIQRRQLGFAGKQPLYNLHQPFAPDDGWIAEVVHAGACCPEAAFQSRRAIELCEWFPECCSYSGLSLMDSLPPGEYYLARSSIRPRVVSSIYLGNGTEREIRASFEREDGASGGCWRGSWRWARTRALLGTRVSARSERQGTRCGVIWRDATLPTGHSASVSVLRGGRDHRQFACRELLWPRQDGQTARSNPGAPGCRRIWSRAWGRIELADERTGR